MQSAGKDILKERLLYSAIINANHTFIWTKNIYCFMKCFTFKNVNRLFKKICESDIFIKKVLRIMIKNQENMVVDKRGTWILGWKWGVIGEETIGDWMECRVFVFLSIDYFNKEDVLKQKKNIWIECILWCLKMKQRASWYSCGKYKYDLQQYIEKYEKKTKLKLFATFKKTNAY